MGEHLGQLAVEVDVAIVQHSREGPRTSLGSLPLADQRESVVALLLLLAGNRVHVSAALLNGELP